MNRPNMTEYERQVLHGLCDHFGVMIDPENDNRTAFRFIVAYEDMMRAGTFDKSVYEKFSINYSWLRDHMVYKPLVAYSQPASPGMYHILNHPSLKDEGLTDLAGAIAYVREHGDEQFLDGSIANKTVHSARTYMIGQPPVKLEKWMRANDSRKKLNQQYGDEHYQLKTIELENSGVSNLATSQPMQALVVNRAVTYLMNIYQITSAFDDLKVDIADVRTLDIIKAYRIANGMTMEMMARILGKTGTTYSNFESMKRSEIEMRITLLLTLKKEGRLSEHVPDTQSVRALFVEDVMYDSAQRSKNPEPEDDDITPEEFKERLSNYRNIKENLEKISDGKDQSKYLQHHSDPVDPDDKVHGTLLILGQSDSSVHEEFELGIEQTIMSRFSRLIDLLAERNPKVVIPTVTIVTLKDELYSGEYNRIVSTIKFIENYFEVLVSVKDSQNILLAIDEMDSGYLKY